MRTKKARRVLPAWIGSSLATLLLTSSPFELLAQSSTLQVGPVSAQRGEIASGFIEIPEGTDAATRIPVSVIRGTQAGPVLGLIAGNHGYEYPPILALQELRARIDPTSLKGSLILVHVANMPAFLGRTVYGSPIDGENLNRMYPGKQDGTVSERIAHAITTEVIEQSDMLLDMHGGDGNESLRPFVYMPVTGNAALDQKIQQIALAFGLDHIVVDRERFEDPGASVFCDRTATSRGIPALTVESGYLGNRDRGSIDPLVNGVLGVMRTFNMISGQLEAVEHPVYLDRTEVVAAPKTGVLTPLVERGQTVSEGTPLARISNFFGEEVATVRSPFAGEVLYVVGTPPIQEGEPVAMVGATRR